MSQLMYHQIICFLNYNFNFILYFIHQNFNFVLQDILFYYLMFNHFKTVNFIDFYQYYYLVIYPNLVIFYYLSEQRTNLHNFCESKPQLAKAYF